MINSILETVIQSTLVIAARVITANLVNGKKLMGTNLHQR